MPIDIDEKFKDLNKYKPKYFRAPYPNFIDRLEEGDVFVCTSPDGYEVSRYKGDGKRKTYGVIFRKRDAIKFGSVILLG